MPTYLTFRVELAWVEPAPWRSFEIRRTTFMALHQAIQAACGWTNSHLFQFADLKGKRIAGLPGTSAERNPPDANTTQLESFFTKIGTECTYVYDFGDDWVHNVRLMDIREADETYQRRLIGGELAFPPEDCGGLPGYMECIAISMGGRVPHMNAEEREDREEWLDDWKPNEFDLVGAKRRFDA